MTNTWWRFSSYRMLNGVLLSSPGTLLEPYDPWDDYNQSLDETGQISPPYLSLVEMVESVPIFFSPTTGFKLSPPHEQRVLEWVCHYGLLGLLQHRTLKAVLAPRWTVKRLPPNGTFIPIQLVYLRDTTNLRYRWQTIPYKDDGLERTDEPPAFDRAIAGENQPKSFQPAGVFVQEFETPDVRFMSFTDAWSEYFPDLVPEERESFDYPEPSSDQFWPHYGEPFAKFWSVATTFSEIVRGLDEALIKQHEIKTVGQAREKLHALLKAAAPTIYLQAKGSSGRQMWSCGSLLASFSAMLFCDLTQRHLRSCARCKKMFVTSAWQGQYCSNRCRYNEQKKRQRDKKRAAVDPKKIGHGNVGEPK